MGQDSNRSAAALMMAAPVGRHQLRLHVHRVGWNTAQAIDHRGRRNGQRAMARFDEAATHRQRRSDDLGAEPRYRRRSSHDVDDRIDRSTS